MKREYIIIILFVMPLVSPAQSLDVFERKTFTRDGHTLLYRILYPKAYNKKKAYPVLTFLHGIGERGDDNEAQLTRGGKLFARDSVRKRFPAIVIFPQCPKDSAWRAFNENWGPANYQYLSKPSTPALLVKMLLDSLVSSKVADPRRLYIGGLSWGGFGTFDMIERYPGFFAAAVPICGGGDLTMAKGLPKKLAVWIFHGEYDESVNVSSSRQYYSALKSAGVDVRYTEYKGVGHNSWDHAFKEKQLLPWLLSKAKR